MSGEPDFDQIAVKIAQHMTTQSTRDYDDADLQMIAKQLRLVWNAAREQSGRGTIMNDFDQIALRIITQGKARDQVALIEQFRLVWNARGAADQVAVDKESVACACRGDQDRPHGPGG